MYQTDVCLCACAESPQGVKAEHQTLCGQITLTAVHYR
jgi:hypothetical protein